MKLNQNPLSDDFLSINQEEFLFSPSKSHEWQPESVIPQ